MFTTTVGWSAASPFNQKHILCYSVATKKFYFYIWIWYNCKLVSITPCCLTLYFIISLLSFSWCATCQLLKMLTLWWKSSQNVTVYHLQGPNWKLYTLYMTAAARNVFHLFFPCSRSYFSCWFLPVVKAVRTSSSCFINEENSCSVSWEKTA